MATARLFVAEGARLAITGRDQIRLDAARQELGCEVVAISADTTDVEAMEAAVAIVVEKLGNLDVVFANAGINGVTSLEKTTLSTFEEIVKINLTGVFFTVQATVPYLNNGASVVLNSSALSVLGAPGYSAYAPR